MIAALLSLLLLVPCQHGIECDVRTIRWDSTPTAITYTLYQKADLLGPWGLTVDTCPRTCGTDCAEWSDMCATYAPPPDDDVCLIWNDLPPYCITPCRESCQVFIQHVPAPGDIVFYSLTATNAGGWESGH